MVLRCSILLSRLLVKDRAKDLVSIKTTSLHASLRMPEWEAGSKDEPNLPV